MEEIRDDSGVTSWQRGKLKKFWDGFGIYFGKIIQSI